MYADDVVLCGETSGEVERLLKVEGGAGERRNEDKPDKDGVYEIYTP